MDEITNKNAGSQGQNIRVNGNIAVNRPVTQDPLMRTQQARVGVNNITSPQKMHNNVREAHMQNRHKQSQNFSHADKTIKMLDRVIAVCVFMLFFGLPLFFVNISYQGIGFEKQYYFYLWTFVGIVSMIARGMMGGKIEIRRTSLDIPIGLVWIAFLISAIFSVDKYHSVFGFFGSPINGLIGVTALVFVYYLVVSYISKERIMIMWWAIIASGSIVTLWSFLATMRLTGDSLLRYIPASLTGSFSSLAIFLGMMLPMLIMSFAIISGDVRSSKRAKIVVALLAIVTLLNVVTLSILFGYVKWFVIIAAIGLLLVFVISRSVQVSQKTIIITIGVFLILFGFKIWGQPIIMRTEIQSEASIPYNLSFAIMKEAIKDKPLIGSGPGTYGYDFSLYRPKELNKVGQYDMRFFADRGVFFESVSTVGIIGFVALALVVLTYVNTVIHAFVRSKDEEIKIVSIGLFISSIIALLYGLFWSFDGTIIIYGLLIGALLIGILRGSLDATQDSKFTLSMSASPQHALSFAFLSILVAVGVIYGFVTLGKMFVADIYAGNALRARANSNFVASSTLFERAVRLNGQEGRYYTVISQYGLDLANVELAKPESERDAEAVKKYINGATGTASAGKELMPNDVLANETKGFILENSGGYVQGALAMSMSAYQRASELEPQNPYLDIAIGKLKLVEAQSKAEDAVEEKKALIAEARTLFELAKEKTTFEYESAGQSLSLFAPAHYYLSVVDEALGNVDASIESMTMALQVTQLSGAEDEQKLLSRQINYGFNLARLLQVRGTEDDMANAEKLLLQIIGVNDQEINSHLNLGLLYERTNRKDKAVEEYKKIMAILPETDEKARENIQNLIDTVEQGGSNIDTKSQDAGAQKESAITDQGQKEKLEVLILQGQGGGEDATRSKILLTQGGFDSQVREESAQYSGVIVMYDGKADRAQVKKIEDALRVEFKTVKSERNDEEVAKYNKSVVVTIGSTTQEPQNNQ